MIIDVWKPKTKVIDGKRCVVCFYMINGVDANTTDRVRWKCDDELCKQPDQIHFSRYCHLRDNGSEKYNLNIQLCKQCQNRKENNPMWGKTHTKEVREKLSKIAFKDYNKKLKEEYGIDNVSLLLETKQKKGQVLINENSAKDLCNVVGLDFISLDGVNKHALLTVRCNKGHIFERKWHSLRKGISGCLECYYNRLRENGICNIDGFNLYKQRVDQYTKTSTRLYPKHINNLELRSREWHLDHRFSICEGFKNNIPPYIIGSHYNLEVIDGIENMKKQERCSITIEELTGRYFKEI